METEVEEGFFLSTDPQGEEELLKVSSNFSKNATPLLKSSSNPEKSLEKFLFGNLPPGEDKSESSDTDSSEDEENSESVFSSKRKSAWSDEDDEKIRDISKIKDHSTVSKPLRKKFISIVGAPKWAQFEEKKEEEDSDEEFFSRSSNIFLNKSNKIDDYLTFRKLKDMNYSTHTEGSVIKSAEFHPSESVGLVAGINGTASLFRVDGENNPKIQRIHLENVPIRSAHFSASGDEVIISSEKFRNFFTYNMISGKIVKGPPVDVDKGTLSKFVVSPKDDYIAAAGRFGQIFIFSQKTKHYLYTLKTNSEVKTCTFSPNGERLYTYGADGEIYIWDLCNRTCIRKFMDEGCINGLSIAISPNDRYLATGSDSGVVNIYDKSLIFSSDAPKPLKCLKNLTTPITDLAFSRDSNLLIFASVYRENSVRILNLTRMEVNDNFPAQKFNLGRINCIGFSNIGSYFTLGNNKGSAYLYKYEA